MDLTPYMFSLFRYRTYLVSSSVVSLHGLLSEWRENTTINDIKVFLESFTMFGRSAIAEFFSQQQQTPYQVAKKICTDVTLKLSGLKLILTYEINKMLNHNWKNLFWLICFFYSWCIVYF